MLSFMKKEMDELNYGLVEELGIMNKECNVFLYIDFNLLYDDYKKEPMTDTIILIVTTKEKQDLLKILPNDKGGIFSNLIFKSTLS